MPKTPPTIIAPLPHDPRVIALAKAVSISRREAFAMAAEAWAWATMQAVDDIVPRTAVETIDGIVDAAGFGQAMLAAGLIGVVNDGLVLPAELGRDRRHSVSRGESAEADNGEDSPQARRRVQNAEYARRYRKKKRITEPKTKSDEKKAWRSLGHVAGHEVRLFEGQFGPYAMLLNATVGGLRQKLTTGDKSWSIDTVSLADVLPGLLAKWKVIHDKERGIHDPARRKVLDPTYDALRDASARHADASARHADASAPASARPSAHEERNCPEGNGLGADDASAPRSADALSSVSISSSSLSSLKEKREEEEKEIMDRKIGLLRAQGLPAGQNRHLSYRFDKLVGDARSRWFADEYVAGERRLVPIASVAAADLGMAEDEVLQMGAHAAWAMYRRRILDELEAARDRIIEEASAAAADAAAVAADTPEPVEIGRAHV